MGRSSRGGGCRAAEGSGGIVRSMEDDDLRVRLGMVVWRSSVRLERALKVKSRSL